MNYNFNEVDKFLRNGGDPQAISQAFADAVNQSLASIRNENKMKDVTRNLKDAWNNYMDEFFKYNEMPRGYTMEDWYMSNEEIESIMKQLIDVLPTLAKYLGLFNDTTIRKIEDKTKSNIRPAEKPSRSHDAIADFFDKFGI